LAWTIWIPIYLKKKVLRISSMEKTLLVLGGPTASGKTACGIRVARYFGTEIISADSRQIYRETSIGTAVPSKEELEAVPHHFIQCISLKDSYNASMYEQQVLEKLEDLFSTYDLVVMVGGSGLYIEAVCGGIDDLPSADPHLREQLHQRFQREGLKSLAEELRERDPRSYARVDLKNHMRVLKALEVTLQTGRPYSSFLSATAKQRPFRILKAALNLEREELYRRINERVDHMMESGLPEEVSRLREYREYTAMKTVGYREMFRYLDGELAREEAVDLIKRNTRKFARKQITWFRKENRYQWIESDHSAKVIEWVEEQLSGGGSE
jgi:tRNA dimethylallyltransferase